PRQKPNAIVAGTRDGKAVDDNATLTFFLHGGSRTNPDASVHVAFPRSNVCEHRVSCDPIRGCWSRLRGELAAPTLAPGSAHGAGRGRGRIRASLRADRRAYRFGRMPSFPDAAHRRAGGS